MFLVPELTLMHKARCTVGKRFVPAKEKPAKIKQRALELFNSLNPKAVAGEVKI